MLTLDKITFLFLILLTDLSNNSNTSNQFFGVFEPPLNYILSYLINALPKHKMFANALDLQYLDW